MKNKKEEHTKFGIYYDDDYDYLQHLREVRNTVVHWEQAPDKPVKVSVEIFIRENLKSKSRDFFFTNMLCFDKCYCTFGVNLYLPHNIDLLIRLAFKQDGFQQPNLNLNLLPDVRVAASSPVCHSVG